MGRERVRTTEEQALNALDGQASDQLANIPTTFDITKLNAAFAVNTPAPQSRERPPLKTAEYKEGDGVLVCNRCGTQAPSTIVNAARWQQRSWLQAHWKNGAETLEKRVKNFSLHMGFPLDLISRTQFKELQAESQD